tara:strand:+ start:20317 stop:22275 length:1959 start_codon:yes stop_codon:yes gene_type:complete
MKKIATLIIILLSTYAYSQNSSNYTFGKITQGEFNLKKYKLDTTANAVVLYESGNTVFNIKQNKIIISTKHYKKIKIFNKEGYKHASFSISLYRNKRNYESIEDIKAISHTNFNRTILSKDQIFEERINENWKEVKFTMPNLKDGTIIEVEYTIETPFKFNLTGWEFQSEIPKIFSQYKASIPGNYLYNRKLNGYLRLTTNSATIKKKCFEVPGYSGVADCENITYAMVNIPAFEEEEYMTHKDNFKSKMKFELTELNWFDGSKQKYTTTWKAVDKEFKTDRNIGGQLKKTSFFEDNLPKKIKLLTTDLEKAKAVYNFIQNHFTWNKKYSIFKNVKVKNAYEDKIGNVGEINISLINALKAAGLNAELVLVSTRENGFATKIYPVISDFNYVIAKVNIGQKFYLLDATEKLAPFGLLPFRCLNSYGRAMDFENDSYWIDILPDIKSKTQLTAKLILNEDGSIEGKLRKSNFGYHALARRKKITYESEESIIAEFENEFNNLEVIDYTIKNKTKIDKPIVENFEILIENIDNLNKLFLNPFFDEKFSKNPFKQENRLYPVDFGHSKQYSVNFSLEIPDNYSVESLPESKSFVLPENGGNFKYLIRKNNDYRITLISSIKINKPIFYNFEYESLKELFKQIIISQKTPIVLKKN